MPNNTPDTKAEDTNSIVASWIVTAILIAVIVIAAFYFVSGSGSTAPEVPNTGEKTEVMPPGENQEGNEVMP